MSLIQAFQGLSLIRHKGEINRRSCGAPATIPLQPSMHKPCFTPPDPSPLTPCLILEVEKHPLKESHSDGTLAEHTPPQRQSNELV